MVGLKPMVREVTSGGGSMKSGCCTSEIGRLRFRELVGVDWGRWEDNGERILKLD